MVSHTFRKHLPLTSAAADQCNRTPRGQHMRRVMNGLAIAWLVSLGVMAATQASLYAARATPISMASAAPG